MAVVINEFESVPAASAPPQTAESQAGGEGNASPSEDEIERLVEIHKSRHERIRAH